jgi:hypothetical protein
MLHPSPETLAAEFCDRTGLHNTFPRKIEQAIAFKLPLALVGFSPLTVAAIGHWLQQRDIATRLPADRRDLCGCLVAHGGRGFIFFCDADSPEEKRLTMAHETAHFLSDYLWPRQQVLHELGEGVAEVLDGIRPATPAERASDGLRLRTACDLEPKKSVAVTRPSGFVVPEEKTLIDTIQTKIAVCGQQELFAAPPITEVAWGPRARTPARTRRDEDIEGGEGDREE